MEIDYSDKQIENICLYNKQAQKALGRPIAKKLQRRLADIDSADNVRELVAGRPHPLIGDREGQFALDIGGGARLVFEPDEPIPRLDDESINWGIVGEITIVFIGNYHD